MKKFYLLSKFEVGISFIPFLIIILFSGQYKLFFTYFLITLIHELGHVIVATFFKVKVNRIHLNIFGFNADIDNFEHLRIYKQLLIILAGPLTYFISLSLIKLIYLNDIISLVMYQRALSSNLYIFLFNLLPIYPLDGGRVANILCDKLFTFKVSKKILYFISFVFMTLFVFYTLDCKQYLMYIFLIINFLINILNLNKEWKNFLLRRYYLKNDHKDIIHRHKDLFVYRNNFILKKGELLNEKEAIKEILKKHG